MGTIGQLAPKEWRGKHTYVPVNYRFDILICDIGVGVFVI